MKLSTIAVIILFVLLVMFVQSASASVEYGDVYKDSKSLTGSIKAEAIDVDENVVKGVVDVSVVNIAYGIDTVIVPAAGLPLELFFKMSSDGITGVRYMTLFVIGIIVFVRYRGVK